MKSKLTKVEQKSQSQSVQRIACQCGRKFQDNKEFFQHLKMNNCSKGEVANDGFTTPKKRKLQDAEKDKKNEQDKRIAEKTVKVKEQQHHFEHHFVKMEEQQSLSEQQFIPQSPQNPFSQNYQLLLYSYNPNPNLNPNSNQNPQSMAQIQKDQSIEKNKKLQFVNFLSEIENIANLSNLEFEVSMVYVVGGRQGSCQRIGNQFLESFGKKENSKQLIICFLNLIKSYCDRKIGKHYWKMQPPSELPTFSNQVIQKLRKCRTKYKMSMRTASEMMILFCKWLYDERHTDHLILKNLKGKKQPKQ